MPGEGEGQLTASTGSVQACFLHLGAGALTTRLQTAFSSSIEEMVMLSLDTNCRGLIRRRAQASLRFFSPSTFKENVKHLPSVKALCMTGHTTMNRERNLSLVPGPMGLPAHSANSSTHLPFGQQRRVLEHVHDDDKELINPLSHF